MTNANNTRRHVNTGGIFENSIDTFEDLYLYCWAAMLTGSALAVVLFLVVVYVL